MEAEYKTHLFRPSKIQRACNPGSGVAGALLILVSLMILLLGLLVLDDDLGSVLLASLTMILGATLIWSSVSYWKSPKNFPPDGYVSGDEILIKYSSECITYGIKGKGSYELTRERIWKIKKGYFGCALLITPETYAIVIPHQLLSDSTFNQYLSNR